MPRELSPEREGKFTTLLTITKPFTTSQLVKNDLISYSHSSTPPKDLPGLTAVIPAGIHNTYKLLEILSKRLNFPDYFGMNWNALEECLRDFHWTTTNQISIFHEDLPELPWNDLKIYLNILTKVLQFWSLHSERTLLVSFPLYYQDAIVKLTIND